MFDFVLKLFRQISSALGIEWAPLHVPTQRRLQTLATAVWVGIGFFSPILSFYLFVQLLYSRYWWLTMLYACWMLNDVYAANRGERKIEWMRNWSLWRYYSAYFPVNLVKTKELDASKNYLFACYPHGLTSQGAFCSFATNALDFKSKFPGLNTNLATLRWLFLVPFFRDFLLSLGIRSCDEYSLLYFLDGKQYVGNCLVLVAGGAAETYNSHPGTYKVILKRRKGFIRVAMKSGASLVPVFSFGEPDIYKSFKNPEGSLLRRVQETVTRLTSVPTMFPVGRGIFQYSFGLLPLRNPITTVVGAPIDVKRNLEPTEQEIDEVHAQFSQRLIELFETEKKNYVKNFEDVCLEIV